MPSSRKRNSYCARYGGPHKDIVKVSKHVSDVKCSDSPYGDDRSDKAWRANQRVRQAIVDAIDTQEQESLRTLAYQMKDRYMTVNLEAVSKFGTLEFRQGAGTLHWVKITNWINLTQQFVTEGAKKSARIASAPPTASVKNLRAINRFLLGACTAGQARGTDTYKSIRWLFARMRVRETSEGVPNIRNEQNPERYRMRLPV